MKKFERHQRPPRVAPVTSTLTSELLILPDGRILVHNLTSAFAELLSQLNPADEQIRSRVIERTPRGPQTATDP